MKKIVRTVLCCIMGVYLMLGTAKLSSDALRDSEATAQQMSATADFSEPQTRTAEGYVVKAVSGRIAVEDISSGKIIKTTDTRVALLPDNDRAQLSRGIVVKNKSELRSVLEDLCS